MTTISELSVGDTVRLEGGDWAKPYHGSGEGREGIEATVTRVDLARGQALVDHPDAHHVNDTDWPFVLVHRADGTGPEPVPVKTLDEALAAGEYHPAMLPLFEKFSKEACDAGYCPEYDRLARAAGAPTRAEVQRLVEERDGATYRLRYSIVIPLDVVVTAVTEQDARNQGSNATSEWAQIAALLEARIADVKARDAVYQLGSWSGDAALTKI